MTKVTIAARVDAGIDTDLARFATATGRSKSALVAEVLRSYVEDEREFLEAVEAGKAAVRAGKVVDHHEVVLAFERMLRTP